MAAALLGSMALALTPALSAIYGEAFPTEPSKRAALAACAQADSGFDRLIAGDRAKCYARQLQIQVPQQPLPRSREIAQSDAPATLAF